MTTLKVNGLKPRVKDPLPETSDETEAFIEKIDQHEFCMDCPLIKKYPAQYTDNGFVPAENVCPVDWDFTDQRCWRFDDVKEIVKILEEARSII